MYSLRMPAESETQIVIRYPWIQRVVVSSLILVLLTVYIVIRGMKGHSGNVNVVGIALFAALFIGFMVLLLLWIDRRRMIEISEHGIAYRPPIGPTERTKFADVTSIKKATVCVWFGGNFPAFISGMELQLSNYMTMQIPLDLPNGDEVYQRIAKAWERERAASGRRQ